MCNQFEWQKKRRGEKRPPMGERTDDSCSGLSHETSDKWTFISFHCVCFVDISESTLLSGWERVDWKENMCASRLRWRAREVIELFILSRVKQDKRARSILCLCVWSTHSLWLRFQWDKWNIKKGREREQIHFCPPLSRIKWQCVLCGFMGDTHRTLHQDTWIEAVVFATRIALIDAQWPLGGGH